MKVRHCRAVSGCSTPCPVMGSTTLWFPTTCCTSSAAGSSLGAGGTVNAVLVELHGWSGRLKQTPIYFLSEALSRAKTRYSELEKMVYAVVMASSKLKHYFTASVW